jgi:hypothetical protein
MASSDYPPEPETVTKALDQSAVSELWEVRRCELHPVVHPAWTAYEKGEVGREEVARAYRGFWEAVFEPSYVAGLVAAGRVKQEAEELVGELFRQTEVAFAAEPAPIVQDYVHMWLVKK